VRIILAGICVCLLFLTTVQIGVSQPAELPTWDIGDTWAMGTSDIDLTFAMTSEGITFDTTVSGSYYVVYEVVGIEEQEYMVDATGGIEITMDMDISGQASGSMQMEMVTKMDGTLYYTKDELAVNRADVAMGLEIEFSGSFMAEGQTGSLDGSLDASSDMSITYNPPFDLFDFPITVGESWTTESVATVTGSVSGSVSIKVKAAGEDYSISEPISEPIYETVDMSLSVSCPGTVDIPLASTCYKLVVSGTGLAQASPFMPAETLYYSPDRGFIIASEASFSEALSGASLGLEESIPYLGDITWGEEAITSSSVTEQEAQDALAGMGAKGIDLVLIGAIVAIVIVAIAAVLVVVRRRLA